MSPPMAMTMTMAMAMATAMAMAMAMAPKVVPCADFKKSTFLNRKRNLFVKNHKKKERILSRDHENLIVLGERIQIPLTRAP